MDTIQATFGLAEAATRNSTLHSTEFGSKITVELLSLLPRNSGNSSQWQETLAMAARAKGFDGSDIHIWDIDRVGRKNYCHYRGKVCVAGMPSACSADNPLISVTPVYHNRR